MKKTAQNQTEMVITDALLRGVKTVDYNALINRKQQDLKTLRELLRNNGLMENKAIKDLENQIGTMQQQAREWMTEAGFTDRMNDYKITILVEDIKT